MIVLENKVIKGSRTQGLRGTYKVLCALGIIALKASVFEVLGADTSSSSEHEDISKGGTFITVNEGPKLTGTFDEIMRQMENIKKEPVDFSKLMPKKNCENAKVNLNNLTLKNCTVENDRLISGKITKGKMLYGGIVYPKGSRFQDGKCIYNPSAPKG